MKSKTVVILIVFGILFSVAMAVALQNTGAPNITLEGGKKRVLIFPTLCIRTI
ncbi:MAG: hypothetical protein SRB1_01169 [Desulfobacteraceae bacterium Eth-SRB1]|nr:MAG: hypothetical protein SRB2_04768 [Desulfobacteraceae bacterium Eth-SRB2]RZB33395.1 MAG: hypothetical protein SRB1_01169 [Desulfobacteraceae bacterium Eth-SRB1]